MSSFQHFIFYIGKVVPSFLGLYIDFAQFPFAQRILRLRSKRSA